MTDRLRTRVVFRRLNVEHLEDRCTPSAAFEAGQVLVTFADQAGGPALAAVTDSPLTVGTSSLGYGAYLVDLAGGVAVGDAITTFTAVPGVRFAEPNFSVGADLTPNDPWFGSLWGLHNTGNGQAADADIDAPEAWDIATGTGNTVVGVIDTGVDYRHPDLYLNIWINQTEIPAAIRSNLTDVAPADGRITFRDLNDPVNQGIGKITDLNANGRIDAGDLLHDASGWEDKADSNDANSLIDDLIGWDFINNDNDPIDDHNHGTHVAGTIGAIGNNGVGVAGVAWTTQIMALKFLGSSGSGATSGAVGAVNYARGMSARVTNNSWGGGGYSGSLFTAISDARTAGSIFVAAAGNSNSNNDTTPNYPSNYDVDNVVAVAATDRYDKKSSFSSYGATTVDLGAPGTSVYSTIRNGGYATYSGTSMATPHVVGALAVLLDAHPYLTYREAIDRILQKVRPVAALSGITVTGGMLNLQAALTGLSPPPPAADTSGPRVTSSAFVGNGDNFTNVRFTFSEAIKSFALADVYSLTGPGGVAIPANGVYPVGTTNNQFDVTFSTAQTVAGSYTAVIGPNVTDMAGNAMNQNGNTENGEDPGDQYTAKGSLLNRQTFTNNGSYPIRDHDWTDVPIDVTVGQTIADIDVTVEVSHTYDRDLRLYLLAPGGRQITLANRVGGSGNDFKITTFDDEANYSIRDGVAPFNGAFRPEELLSAFDGLTANGTWQFRVHDMGRFDVGTVNSVTLSIQFENGGSWVRTFGFADEPVSALQPVACDFALIPEGEAPVPSGVVLPRQAVRDEPPIEPTAFGQTAERTAPMWGVAWPTAPIADPFDELVEDFIPVEV